MTQVSDSSSEELQYLCPNILLDIDSIWSKESQKYTFNDGHSVMNSNFMGITTQKTGPDIS